MRKLTQIYINDYKEVEECDSCKHCDDSIEMCVLRRCHRAIDELNDAYECEETKNDITKAKAVRELKAFRDSALNPSKEALNMAIDALLNEVWERGEKE
jgi:hypothetical protein